MKKQGNDVLWTVSLIVMAAAVLILAVTAVLGITLPDTAVRVLGVCALVSLPLFVFASVVKARNGKNGKK